MLTRRGNLSRITPVQRVFLMGSLAGMLLGAWLGNPWLLGLAGVLFLVSLAHLGKAPLFWGISFGLWVGSVLAYLLGTGSGLVQDFVWGWPEPAFWMLFGIWLFPVLIWPLAFALHFREWLDR